MGSYSLSDAYQRAYLALRDVGDEEDAQLLTRSEIEAVLAQAARRYSVDRPLEIAVDVTADGTRFLPLPAGWQEGASRLVSIENPIGEDPPNLRDDREWAWYRDPTQKSIRWVVDPPPDDDHVRITYTGLRAWGTDASDTTVLDVDFFAVVDLGVSIGCDWIANHYAQTSDPILSADTVNYRTKAQEWGGRAKRFEATYRAAIGSPETGPGLATGTINWDVLDSNRRDYLWHRRALR